MSQDFSQALGAKIKQLRLHQKLTLVECGELAGLSAGFLSQAENGKTSPSLENLSSIAQALGVSLNYFFTSDAQAAPAVIVRSCEQRQIPLADGRLETLLSDTDANMNILPSIITLSPGECDSGKVSRSEGDIFLYVIDGMIKLRLGDKVELLRPSDSAHFVEKTPYAFWNDSPFLSHVFIARKRLPKEGLR